MFELSILSVLALAGAAAVVTVGAVLVKLLFKLLLLPLFLAGWLIKAVVALFVGLVLLVVLGPFVLGVGLVLVVPLLLLGGLAWGAAHVLVSG